MTAAKQTHLYGREVLRSEFSQPIIDGSNLLKTSGFYIKNGKERCRRCNHPIVPIPFNQCTCDKECSYCTNCLQLGKVKSCSMFFHIPEPNEFKKVPEPILHWKGKLSAQQEAAAQELIQSIDHCETRLLWAVAGAGKTEMLFPGIERAIRQNKRICLASPRVDVCLELAPRIQQAFPDVPISVLYGDMEEPYTYAQLTVATTHQLYRFKEAFDLLIIDEIDAFPYRMDKALQYAAEKSRKSVSTLIFLTATPDQTYQKRIEKKQLKASILPARYHGFALPVPKNVREKNWQKALLHHFPNTKLFKQMQQLFKSQKKFLLFAPNIDWMTAFSEVIKTHFETAHFEAVHSQDPERKAKVLSMRNEELDFLVCTTILERGVTFPNIDVLVIGSDDRIFTESALVQIAGRAGRSPQYPTGNVLFYHDGLTKEIKKAIRQIKKMNEIAKKRGLLNS